MIYRKENIMKKVFKMICAALAVSACMCISSFAAETKEEFRAEAETCYAQMEELNSQIDPLRVSTKEIADRFKEIGKAYKDGGALPVSEEVWDQIKELRKSISDYQSSKEDSTVKEMRKSAKTASESGDYDGALNILKEVVAAKEERLEKANEAYNIWLQIDALLGE